MNTIETIELRLLHNDEHFQFMTEVESSIEETTPDELKIGSTFTTFQQALKAEDTAMKVAAGSSLSGQVTDMGKLRKKTWSAINMRIEATLICPIADERASADVLSRIFKLYGDPRKKNEKEVSSIITNLLGDLLLPVNTPHLGKVGIATWVPELQKQNNQYNGLVQRRTVEVSTRPSGNVKKARVVVDPLYLKMLDDVASSIKLVQANPGAVPFVNEMNERIKKYNVILATRKTINERKKKKKKDDGETQK
jgi:hypothetical protein